MQHNSKAKENLSHWISPAWPAPSQVRALTTLRQGGFSQGPYQSLNLAAHVGDDINLVRQNRQYLQVSAGLPREPFWLTQVHGSKVITLPSEEVTPEADASLAFSANQICAVLTADCLPILVCDTAGTTIAAIHAGWRGLAAGVIEATFSELTTRSKDFMCWLGPAIGPDNFVVGQEVFNVFKAVEDRSAFIQDQDKWRLNIYQLAKGRLAKCGVTQIFGGDFCTYRDTERFYSYRRSPQTGRMASLIWIEP